MAGVWFPASERGTAAAILGALAPQVSSLCLSLCVSLCLSLSLSLTLSLSLSFLSLSPRSLPPLSLSLTHTQAQLGVVTSYILGPLLVRSHHTKAVCDHNSTADSALSQEWTNEIYDQMLYYNSGQAGASLLLLIVTLVGMLATFCVIFFCARMFTV